ncbi:MAG: FmdB family transcriptional regulator [Actinobacteria bacterium]|jgi:predicted nucleic acid-binding Zn ribbon protein|nr:FmdB family transcriptional regulator [Actinomycetota bacterium]
MPTYVYKFIDSGETIEVQQAFTDDPFTELAHPVDGVVKPVKKVFTPVGVSFKGGGFYKTDSRSGSSTSSASTTASKPADTAAPAAATTPAAPAAPAASPSPAATT